MQSKICFLEKVLFLSSGPVCSLEVCQSFGFSRCEAEGSQVENQKLDGPLDQ